MRKSIIQKEKSNRTNQIILGIILVGMMFFSVVGYSFQGETGGNTNKIIYNGFEFINQNEYWFLEMGNYQFSFKFNPNQVGRIDSELKYLNSYSGKPLYISSENNEASSEIYRNLFYNNGIVQRMQSACLTAEECKDNSPIKTCSDNFIIIKESTEVGITQNEGCVFITGPQEDLTQISDEFLFKILNVD